MRPDCAAAGMPDKFQSDFIFMGLQGDNTILSPVYLKQIQQFSFTHMLPFSQEFGPF